MCELKYGKGFSRKLVGDKPRRVKVRGKRQTMMTQFTEHPLTDSRECFLFFHIPLILERKISTKRPLLNKWG